MALISDYKTHSDVDLDVVENGSGQVDKNGIPPAPAAHHLDAQHQQHSVLEVLSST